MMPNVLANQLEESLSRILPGAVARLPEIDRLPKQVALSLLGTILGFACRAQNIGNILAGRAALAQCPREWLAAALQSTAGDLLDLNDEWEYCRLLECVDELMPDSLTSFIVSGMCSPNPAVREAAENFTAKS